MRHLAYLTSDIAEGKRTEYPAFPEDVPAKLRGHLDDGNGHDHSVGRVDQIGQSAQAYQPVSGRSHWATSLFTASESNATNRIDFYWPGGWPLLLPLSTNLRSIGVLRRVPISNWPPHFTGVEWPASREDTERANAAVARVTRTPQGNTCRKSSRSPLGQCSPEYCRPFNCRSIVALWQWDKHCHSSTDWLLLRTSLVSTLAHHYRSGVNSAPLVTYPVFSPQPSHERGGRWRTGRQFIGRIPESLGSTRRSEQLATGHQ